MRVVSGVSRDANGVSGCNTLNQYFRIVCCTRPIGNGGKYLLALQQVADVVGRVIGDLERLGQPALSAPLRRGGTKGGQMGCSIGVVGKSRPRIELPRSRLRGLCIQQAPGFARLARIKQASCSSQESRSLGAAARRQVDG